MPNKLGIPTGTIPTTLNIAYGRGDPWSNVTVDAPFHEKYGNPYGIAAMLMAMEVVETGGRMIWNTGGSGAYGIMQIKESSWGWLAKKLGADLRTREGQIQVAAEILGKEGRGANPRERFLYSYYPVLDRNGNLCLDCKGEDGGTPRQYLEDIDTLIDIINAAGEVVATDLCALVMGTPNYNLTFDWAAYGGPDFYQYGKGHSHELDGSNHTGLDIVAAYGAPLYSAFDGTVVCGATNWGSGAWQTGCAAFGDTMGGGVGRIEILHTDGQRSLIYGHCHDSLVSPGQSVRAGDRIATVGGMNGAWHVHLEARQKRGTSGDYTIHDPRILFADLTGGVLPKAERIDVPQPGEFDRTWTVTVTTDATPVLQRADPNASPVAEPLAKGEQFEAAYLTISDSTGEPYWVSKARGRVPARNTNLAEVLGIETTGGKPDLTELRNKVSDLLHDADNYLTTAIDSTLYAITEASNS